MLRGFTFIDDAVESVARIQAIPRSDPSCPYQIFNVGHGTPVTLMEIIEALEQAIGIKALKNLLPSQPGDMYITYADTQELSAAIHFPQGIPERRDTPVYRLVSKQISSMAGFC